MANSIVIKRVAAFLIALSALAVSVHALPAIAVETGLNATADVAGLKGGESGSIPLIVARLITQLLRIVGVIFVGLMIYGGFRWMTAADNQEAVKEAKGVITNSIIGIVIVFAAYAITSYIIDSVLIGSGSVPAPTSEFPVSGNE